MAACSSSSSSVGQVGDDEVIGGKASTHPAVVMFVSAGAATCSGSLIAPDIVVTAAHCVTPIRPNSVYIGYSKPSATDAVDELRAPSGDAGVASPPSGDWEEIGVAGVIAHPTYDPSAAVTCPVSGVDLAVVRLARASEKGRPIELGSVEPKVDERCTVFGFGRHSTNLTAPQSQITDWTYGEQRSAEVRVVTVQDGHIEVAGISGAHSSGDSGGLLLCGGKAAGVTSCSRNIHRKALEDGKYFQSLVGGRSFVRDAVARLREPPRGSSDPGAGAGDGGDAGPRDAGDGGR